jgi:predicted enzyme related to lactoylglutathione lyase
MKRVTGFGGVFFKARDHKALCAWYEKHLGIPFGTQNYMAFKWADGNNEAQTAQSVFSIMPDDTTYYAPSQSSFMLNFRVDDLDALVVALQAEGIALTEEPQSYSYGKFAWIMDPEGNKIELWEAIDDGF